ncbi:MAG: helix-turn-helix domain-containing protein [Dermatophilaceae bacterium]
MSATTVLEQARRRAGLSQSELAERAHTSRTAVSAYENGHKSPSLGTLERLLAAAGFEVDMQPTVAFARVRGPRGQRFTVPDRLWSLAPDVALATVELPLRLNWSQPRRTFRLADRADRARVYEIILREGTADDIRQYIDGALLVDLWPDLVLPQQLRTAWAPLVEQVSTT